MAELVDLSNYSGECQIIGEGGTLIPEGRYELACIDWKTAKMFNTGKLVIEFRIVSAGKYFGKELRRYYNVELIGKPNRNARFRVRRSTDFAREYAALFGAPRRLDRISMSRFESVVILGRIKTVNKARGRVIPETAQYSVVAELLKIEAGNIGPESGA